MTERLRQLHFQWLVFKYPLLGSGTGAIVERSRTLADFLFLFDGHCEAQFTAMLDDEAMEAFDLVGAPSSDTVELSEDDELFAAYRTLRLEHQISYANFKLNREGTSARSLHVALGQISLWCIVSIVLTHVVIAVTLASGVSVLAENVWLHVAVLWLVVVVLVVRAFEEGLQPGREIERYTAYRAALRRLLISFDRAGPAKDRLRIMAEVELVIYGEMQSFLRTHEEAKFLL
jgi:hypothetical protein